MKLYNKDFNYISLKKQIKFKKTNLFFQNKSKPVKSKKVKFVFLRLYQEGFFSNYFYGFLILNKLKKKLTLYRPTDGSFFVFSLSMPSLIQFLFK